MVHAVRRLQAIQNALTDNPVSADKKVDEFILPDGAVMTVRSALVDSTPQTTLVYIDGLVVCEYRILDRTAQLVISAVGTEFEHTASHVPTFPVIEIFLSSSGLPQTPRHDISVKDMWATVYALFTLYHVQETIPVVLSQQISNCEELCSYLLRSGLGRTAHAPTASKEEMYLHRATFWQGAGTQGYHPRGWLPPSSISPLSVAPFPYIQSFTRTPTVIAVHPLRPQKPEPGEIILRRFCPSIGETLEFKYFDLRSGSETSEHLDVFHRWHNSERVNRGWGERGSLEKHRTYITNVMNDPAVLPVMMSWNGEHMGYAEITYLKENHVAAYIPGGLGDWDRGLHVLVGEDKFRGTERTNLWHRALIHYCFLADPRTEHVMGEPKADNASILKVDFDSAMHIATIFDFPYKRSALTCVTRERFFRLDLL
ncbi:acyl-CoA N-acyltransferase [Suillus paluster]|uniref:acyl-CoA N-acyltransferase n=1 Tax=Suillus paluster TaxID=48578 RepID=UPI001B87DFC2|nr:acyl-CoA N-acyltransferase [Suillus paluster]KAG1722782.1 acyl-CoA N-acyltransferase [Suillus paluster]